MLTVLLVVHLSSEGLGREGSSYQAKAALVMASDGRVRGLGRVAIYSVTDQGLV